MKRTHDYEMKSNDMELVGWAECGVWSFADAWTPIHPFSFSDFSFSKVDTRLGLRCSCGYG